MRQIFFNAILITLLFVTTLNATPIVEGESARTMNHNKIQRRYRCYVPKSYKSKTPAPLLFAFHGGGSNPEKFKKLTRASFNKIADREGFIVVYPEAIDGHWNDGRGIKKYKSHRDNIDDVGFISALIDKFSQTLTIDNKRIYAVGMSNGAMMTHRLALELSNRLAGVAAVAGALSKKLATQKKPSRPVPILMINATKDPIVPYKGGTMRLLFRKLGEFLSAKEAAAFWRKHNFATNSNSTKSLDRNPDDGIKVDIENWSGKAAVAVYTVHGGGHTWPGGPQYLPKLVIGKAYSDFDGATVIWNFFKSTTRPNAVSEPGK